MANEELLEEELADEDDFEDSETEVISLIDGDVEYEFEVVDKFEYEGKIYYVVMPLFEDIDRGIEADDSYMIFEAVNYGTDDMQFVEPDKDMLEELEEIAEDYLNGVADDDEDDDDTDGDEEEDYDEDEYEDEEEEDIE